ncbi:MAG TPA: thioredoxin domain-containing protein [Terriglobales bacterium]|nr:thioredoxin domain-containing protein [Terriglobales bacterium]
MISHKSSFLLLLFLLGTALTAQVASQRALRPPPGASVALVVFEDLECPDCKRAAPLLEEAARAYKIPLVRHDFPLPKHNWSFDAAVLARFFDTKSKKTGDEFRAYIFQNQEQITRETLRPYAERFASDRKVDLPFAVDPRGELAKKVKADYALGQAINIQHTPTIYVVSNKESGTPFVEVVDRTNLYAMIDKMKREAVPVSASATKSTKKSATPQ